MAAPWEAIATKKRTEQQSQIPKAWLLPNLPPFSSTTDVRSIPQTSGILSQRELTITSSHDATSLAALICDRKYTAEEVCIAFCKRAAIAQQVTNCLTEILFDAGIARAQWLDSELRRTGRLIGPLHGVPISLKDTFKIRGTDSSIGIASLAFKPAESNSALVDILLGAGAVLYCKTNVPQTLMALDSDNWLFARVRNPRNGDVTAGGSSGGEGALIAMRGSVLGVGTDVGGSIRIPAMCNGLYGIKPSVGRVPYAGQQGNGAPGSGSVGLMASAGPIAGSLRDCELLLKVVAEARPWERDPDVVYGLWEEQGKVERKPLIGVVREDGLIKPLPPVSKVLEETVQALRRAGYEVVELDTPLLKTCQSLANTFFGIDGNNYILDLLSSTSEPLIPWLSSRLRRKPAVSASALVELHARKTALETEMLKIWTDKKGRRVDAFICPVAPHPVPPIDRWNGTSYTSSFVLLDYPAGTIPVRDFVEDDLRGELEGEVLNGWDKINRELCECPLHHAVGAASFMLK
jgi:amidase